MTISELDFLTSSAGKELLERYVNDDETALFRLLLRSKKKLDSPYLGAVVSLLKLRRKAQEKFSRAAEMFFSSLALEQATGEKISNYLAQRFKKEWRVADLTCGLGGNLISLARRCRRVIAIDQDEVNLACARLNTQVWGVSSKIKFILAEVQEELSKQESLGGVDALFLDPSRYRPGKTKTRSFLNSQPPLLEILPAIFSITKNLGVKISPAFDYRELKLLPEQPEVEVISEHNTNKVVMLWFGDLKTAERRATILTADGFKTYQNQPRKNPVFVKQALNYWYEPNKAIVKAHLVDDLALKYQLSKLSPYLPFLTSQNIVQAEIPDLWRVFKVLASETFSWSALQKFIKARHLERANVIVKHLPFKPEEVYRRTKLKEGGQLFLIFTILGDQQAYYILAERI